MNRNAALKIVNPIMGLLALSQVTTGLLRDAISDEVYEVLHGGGGIALAVVMAVHVTLNWNWIKANFLARPSAGGA